MSDDTIHINTNFGKVTYEAYIGEFAADIGNEPTWDELTENAQEAWGDVYYTIIENRIVLPRNGVEVSIRTPSGVIGYAWSGMPDQVMKDEVMEMLWLHMTGAEQ